MLPESFLECARTLANGSGPADYRSATSRAYYAVYNTAVKLLERMSIHKPKNNYHQILQQRLQLSGDTELKQIGSDLSDFHEERVEADYRLDSKRPENQSNAQAAVQKAEAMIAILAGCPTGGARAKKIYDAVVAANLV